MGKLSLIKIICCLFMIASLQDVVGKNAIRSIDTGESTIQKVRTANDKNNQIVVASDYDGKILGIDYSGKILWKTQLGEGTMNHDVWCEDITNDNIDEIMVANANGHLYCLSIKGKVLWDFKPYEGYNLTPMYSVCVVKDKMRKPYVVCGDYTSNCYYLDSKGKLVMTLPSIKYSKVKGWGKERPQDFKSNANFLRPLPLSDGSDLLVVHASNNHMQSAGELYLLEPLSANVISRVILSKMKGSNTGELRVVDPNNDGHYDILMGSSTLNTNLFCKITFSSDYSKYDITQYILDHRSSGVVSYRVNQPFILKEKNDFKYMLLSSNQLVSYPSDGSTKYSNRISTIYAYYDVWSGKDDKIILASSQDGGSCVHIIDTHNSSWKSEFERLQPIGKIEKIKEQTKLVRKELKTFKKPSWQREPEMVIGLEGLNLPIASNISDSKSLTLLASPWNRGHCQDVSWRNNEFSGNKYLTHLDGRNKYDWDGNQIYNFFIKAYDNTKGLSTWAGHGNDPLYYDLKVLNDIADYGYEHGKKKTVYIYPEMNHTDSDFKVLMDKQVYPLIEHMRKDKSYVAFRAKNIFWQGQVYTDTWNRVTSGEYSDVVVPLLEETTDKTQDLSIAGRLGLWTSGAVDSWGVRCSRDDPSFDRSRQFSSQKLGNHNLLKTIYSIASGATFIHNSYPDTENDAAFDNHSSLVLELIAKEALYVPKRNEILSFSPIHLSIVNPQERYLNEAENNKWTTWFNRDFEDNNPAVFSHMNGTWLGAAVTPWDFSSYASGVVDRRQNSVPSYHNGLVLITPVQDGALANKNVPRGRLVDHLHPFYKDKMKEYITDGVNYISADGNKTYRADEYYYNIKKDIEASANLLPITVSGDQVGWVVAQVSPTHLRLTLVDGGYLNPKDRKVKVAFHNIKPVKIKDILSNNEYPINQSVIDIDIPCGMFRFIDIELKDKF